VKLVKGRGNDGAMQGDDDLSTGKQTVCGRRVSKGHPPRHIKDHWGRKKETRETRADITH